jgi:hypothetical protein
MDAANRFETPTTFALVRIEYAAVLAVSVVLTAVHHADVDWRVFAALFAVVDVIGYVPGAIAFRATGGRPPKVFYVLYNVMHSITTWVAVLGVWSLAAGPQWAFLAIAIHLAGDRSIFGNSLKSFRVSFEPAVHPAFRRFEDALAERGS